MSQLPKISDAEWQVMKVLWEKGPITSKEVVEILKSTTKWSSTTIYTLINRLVNKKAVGIKEGSSPYICYALIPQEEITMEESQSFLKRVFDGSLNLMLVNFLKNDKLSQNEIEELKNILDNNKD
ncbi:BlaI/MecI/CopY family transcriptional regulator [Clostridium lundense]|uniref:BlaI/MecI/CopY family transcriptional regulator n=1 Tax=Clostridium lundense TaxID=319475 RepID=UPI00048613D2|nr:BlaI/MecI/CopY family transcriptional regulator [Clostridium lundense]